MIQAWFFVTVHFPDQLRRFVKKASLQKLLMSLNTRPSVKCLVDRPTLVARSAPPLLRHCRGAASSPSATQPKQRVLEQLCIAPPVSAQQPERRGRPQKRLAPPSQVDDTVSDLLQPPPTWRGNLASRRLSLHPRACASSLAR